MSEPSIWDREFDEQEVPEGWVEESTGNDPVTTEESPGQDVISLLNLGELQEKVTVRGHDITLHTLKMDEELEIGLLIKKYQGSLEEGRALATALVAAAIKSIDGHPLVQTIGPDESLLQRKFDYVRTRMYWPVIRQIYEEGYLPLIERQVEALEEFRKK